MNNSKNNEVAPKRSRLTLEETIFIKVVDSLYLVLPSSVAATSIIGTSLVIILWEVIDTTVLLVWLSTLLLVSFSRYILYKQYLKKANTDIVALKKWDHIFYILLVLTALVWACVSIWLLPTNGSIEHYLPALILIGISAGAVTSLGPSMKNIITYFLLLLGPLLISEFLNGTYLSYIISLLIILFMGLALSNAKRVNQTIRENVTLNYKSELHNQELTASRNDAVAANSAKTSFISMISHELRTPLNGILGYSQLLNMSAQPSLNEEQSDSVNGIIDSGNHLLSLIEELLDLSRIEAHKLNVIISDVSMSRAIDESISLLSPVAAGFKISINNQVKNDYIVKADEKRVKQVLINLISNAIKYNHEQGEVNIHVDEVEKDKIKISVSDNGDGITEEQQKELFEPFIRHNNSKEGIGLGLYITQNLIELMHGKMGLESVIDKGSTFWFELPLADNKTH